MKPYESRRKNPKMSYDQLQESEEGHEVRKKLREYNVHSQNGLCAYCCKVISAEEAINEHIRPRGDSRYAKFSMEYDNLVASCRSQGNDLTCSASKQNAYDEKMFVSPLQKECEEVFEYYRNGEVVSDLPEGQYTIKLLNLNSYRLRKARAAQLKVCDSYDNVDTVKEIFLNKSAEGRYQAYIDIIRYFYGRDVILA